MSVIPVSSARRTLDIKEALTLKREGAGGTAAYGVGVPNADHTLLIPAEDLNLSVPKMDKYMDDDLIGRGHEYTTQQTIIKWLMDGFTRGYKCNPTTDLIFWYFGLGGIGTTTPEAGAYLHTIKQLDFSSVDLVLPSFSSIQRAQASWLYKVLGQVVQQVEVTITRTQLATMKVTFRGSGKIEEVGSFTYPAPTVLRYFRGASAQFEMGLHDGTRDDYKQVLNELTITFTNEFVDNAAYFPGSGSQSGSGSQGQVKGIELVGKRSISVKANLYHINSTLWDWARQEKLVQLFAKLTGGEIAATGENYFSSYWLPCLNIESLEPVNLDNIQGWTVNFKPQIVSDLTVPDVLQVQVQNDIAGTAIGAIPA